LIKNILLFVAIILGVGCSYYDSIDYIDENGLIRYNLDSDINIESIYLYNGENAYDKKNLKDRLTSSLSICSDNTILLEKVEIQFYSMDGLLLKCKEIQIEKNHNGLTDKFTYKSFDEMKNEKMICDTMNIWVIYDYQYLQYEDLKIKYIIDIKKNNTNYRIREEKKIHRKIKRVRNCPRLKL